MAIAFTPIDIETRKAIDFTSGDTVRVWSKIEDKGKYRLQAFEGLVLARKHGTDPQATFTVRKISNNVGVERIFPLFSPSIDKIEITKRAKTRRSKLYYIRDKAAKEIRRKMKTIVSIGKGSKKLEIPETVTEAEASEE
ncbi:MAG: 50S ribosomal protein L19 [Patescibacteria group bacterium]